MTAQHTHPTAPHDSQPAALADRYLEPKGGTLLFNRLVARLTRMGLSVWGSRELQVVGRRSGEVRTTPVNLLELDGRTYLVAPRGQTQWVRNLRAAGGRGGLRLGRHVDEFRSTEVADADKIDILRAYLRRWKFEVGAFFDGVDASSSDEELLAIAPGHPVFVIELTERRGA
jgi:deazaflavin-dependent oxidoreductase (nitroreductase family)